MPTNQTGAIPLIGLVIIISLISFFVVSSIAPLKNALFSNIYPKESSFASEMNQITFNVKDFGAKGDGVTDDFEAFQKAIDAAATSSAAVKVEGDSSTTYLIKHPVYLKSHTKLLGTGAKIKKDPTKFHLLNAKSAVEDVTLEGLILDYDNSLAGGYLLFLPNGSSRITINNSHFINTTNTPVIEVTDGNSHNSDFKMTNSSIERTIGKQQFENSYSLRIYNWINVLLENNLFSHCLSIQLHDISPQANTSTDPSRSLIVRNNQFIGIQDTNLFLAGNSSQPTYVSDISITNNTFSDGGKWIEKGAIAIYTGLNSSIKNLTISNNQIKDLGYHGSSEGFACCNVTQMIYLAGQNRDQNSWPDPTESFENVSITDNVIDGISTSRIAYGILAQPNIKIVNWKVTNNTVKNTYYSIEIRPTVRENVIVENNITPEEIKARDDKRKATMLDVRNALNSYKSTTGNYCLGVAGCSVSIAVNCNNCYTGEPKNAVDTLRSLLAQKDRFNPDIGLRIVNKDTFWLFTKLENPPSTTCPVISSAAKWYFEPTVNYCIGN